MVEDKPESPLVAFHLKGRRSETEEPGVTMIEHPFLGFIDLRGDVSDDVFVSKVRSALGVTVPCKPNTMIEANGYTVCWMGPDQWMVIVCPNSATGTVVKLQGAVTGLHAAVTDVTGGYTLFSLTGRHVRDLLAKGCTLDLHPREFDAGQCAQTNQAKTGILMIPRANDAGCQAFDLVARRSFADYLAHWVEHSAREYGLHINSERV